MLIRYLLCFETLLPTLQLLNNLPWFTQFTSCFLSNTRRIYVADPNKLPSRDRTHGYLLLRLPCNEIFIGNFPFSGIPIFPLHSPLSLLPTDVYSITPPSFILSSAIVLCLYLPFISYSRYMCVHQENQKVLKMPWSNLYVFKVVKIISRKQLFKFIFSYQKTYRWVDHAWHYSEAF